MQQDYNHTINLPKTEFPMRAGLPKREPGFLENWEKDDLYHELMKKNEGKPLFILHDGPPYANGNLHMGHALNKILKDVILRSRNVLGYHATYIPGWDTHGLPIERQAIKAYGMDRSKVSTAEFRSKCEEFAHEHVNTQRTEFKRLGVIGDWDRPYLTLTHDYEAAQIDGMGVLGRLWHVILPAIWPTVTVFIMAGFAGYFTNQGATFSFFGTGTQAKDESYTFGYWLFVLVNGTKSEAEYPLASTAGVVFTIIAVPVTLLSKRLLEKFGPRED